MKVYYVKQNIFHYYNDSTLRWIFFRISFNTYTELIEYILNYSIDNEKYSKLSLKNQQDFYKLFNIFFKTYRETKHVELKKFIEINIHKIVAFKNNLKIIKTIHNYYKSPDIFNSKDNYGYYPFIDCVRYCDVITVRWFIKNIFHNIQNNISVIQDCIFDFDLIKYAVNNLFSRCK